MFSMFCWEGFTLRHNEAHSKVGIPRLTRPTVSLYTHHTGQLSNGNSLMSDTDNVKPFQRRIIYPVDHSKPKPPLPQNTRTIRHEHIWNKHQNRWDIVHDTITGRQPQPEGFGTISYTISTDKPIPMGRRRDERSVNPNSNLKTYNYPRHDPNKPTYNLYCALDQMKVGHSIDISGRENYKYAYYMACSYSGAMRTNKKYPIPMRFRGMFNPSTQVGTIWRIE